MENVGNVCFLALKFRLFAPGVVGSLHHVCTPLGGPPADQGSLVRHVDGASPASGECKKLKVDLLYGSKFSIMNGPSPYELQIRKNIEENKKVLASLGLDKFKVSHVA